ncbi:MAG: ATP-dependent protease [Alphaproteobacteria bacterium]|nr:ATP-dependent protease [Alphaproteobacteria bacterium]
MFSLADLPDKIPLFPLPGALLLPRGRLPLNIFEPRYLAMLDDTLKTSHRLIGMIQPTHTEDQGDTPRLHQIGCAGRLVGFNEAPDGRYRVTLAGVSRFRLKVVENGFAPYLRAAVSWPEFERDLGKPEKDAGFEREAFLGSLGRFFRATGMNSDWESLERADNELLINSLSMMFPFEIEDKQALLEAPTLQDRRETLVALMEFAMASGSDGGLMQ